MERYDAAVVGAGPEGLIAAATLAGAGRRVVVLERQGRAGGRAETYEFHPGFKASPYTDELPEIPSRLFRALDLARHGALLAPAPASVCLSDEGTSILYADDERTARAVPAHARDGLLALRREVEALRLAIDGRAIERVEARLSRFAFWKYRRSLPWPGEEWGQFSLDAVLKSRISDSALRLHMAADAVSGRAVSPFLAGTALHLLAPSTGRSGVAAGGLGVLGSALHRAASKAGAVIRYGAEVKAIQVKGGRAVAVLLAGGEEVTARAVLSSLDVKRTFLDMVDRSALRDDTAARVSRYRMAGQSARVLVALDRLPEFKTPFCDSDIRSGPIHVVSSLQALSRAHESWNAGLVPEAPLITLRFPSLADPRLAPPGKALMTATLSAVPFHLADGPWNRAKRERLAQLVFAAAHRVLPGALENSLSIRVIVSPDIETVLGATEGDLDGGELAPDQALGFRPFGDGGWDWTQNWRDGRTPITGLYLGGPSSAPSPVLLGVAGARTAHALLADFDADLLA